MELIVDFWTNKGKLLAMLGFPGGSVVKNPPAKQEMQVWSLGQEDPMEEEMVTHSSFLSWKISWIEEPGGLPSPWGHKETQFSN